MQNTEVDVDFSFPGNTNNRKLKQTIRVPFLYPEKQSLRKAGDYLMVFFCKETELPNKFHKRAMGEPHPLSH